MVILICVMNIRLLTFLIYNISLIFLISLIFMMFLIWSTIFTPIVPFRLIFPNKVKISAIFRRLPVDIAIDKTVIVDMFKLSDLLVTLMLIIALKMLHVFVTVAILVVIVGS